MTNITLQNKENPPAWMVPSDQPTAVAATPEEGLAGSVEESEKISAAEKSLLQKVIRKGLVENHHDLEVQRKDPNSPLYSVKTFEALNL
jgi:ATP-dependent RNA helicase DDX19/DBP5